MSLYITFFCKLNALAKHTALHQVTYTSSGDKASSAKQAKAGGKHKFSSLASFSATMQEISWSPRKQNQDTLSRFGITDAKSKRASEK